MLETQNGRRSRYCAARARHIFPQQPPVPRASHRHFRDHKREEKSLTKYCTRHGSRRFRLQKLSRSDFGTAGWCHRIIIFFLTSFFINSIHQLVATKQRCRFSMKNGRENRTNGNEEKGEKEKEALTKLYEVKKGTQIASPKFFVGRPAADHFLSEIKLQRAQLGLFASTARFGIRLSFAGHKLR
jgi:hypothetical protein